MTYEVIATVLILAGFLITVVQEYQTRIQRKRAEKAERLVHDANGIAARERERKEMWLERASEWRQMYVDERKSLELLQAEHTALLKAMAPEYVLKRAQVELAGAEPEQDDTPSVGEADRREAARRREKAVQAEQARRIREEGYSPVVVSGSDAVPPPRIDATAHDESDVDGE